MSVKASRSESSAPLYKFVLLYLLYYLYLQFIKNCISRTFVVTTSVLWHVATPAITPLFFPILSVRSSRAAWESSPAFSVLVSTREPIHCTLRAMDLSKWTKKCKTGSAATLYSLDEKNKQLLRPSVWLLIYWNSFFSRMPQVTVNLVPIDDNGKSEKSLWLVEQLVIY